MIIPVSIKSSSACASDDDALFAPLDGAAPAFGVPIWVNLILRTIFDFFCGLVGTV
jgi:hypothetical protein